MIRKNFIVATSLLCYATVLVPPDVVPFLVLGGYLVPGILALNALLFVIFLVFNRKRVWRPLIALIAGFPFIYSTFQWSTPDDPAADTFSVLNFNSKLYRRPGSYREFSMELIEWTESDSSDIKVLPEHSTDSRWPLLDVNARVASHGYGVYSESAPIDYNEHNLGSAIFSKFPMGSQGIVFNDTESISMALFQDVRVGRDTVRIYSVHLASMGLETIRKHNAFVMTFDVATRLINGAMERSKQLDKLIAHFNQSPHPFIVCGDFNETPYSYNYARLCWYLDDAFVAEGNGVGLTFNTATPLARIDYQFASAGLEIHLLEVDRSMRISDHYPVRGRFRVEK